MNLSKLPDEIIRYIYIYIYIADCVRIPNKLSEDIRHVAECKQRIREVAETYYFKHHDPMYTSAELICRYLDYNTRYNKLAGVFYDIIDRNLEEGGEEEEEDFRRVIHTVLCKIEINDRKKVIDHYFMYIFRMMN